MASQNVMRLIQQDGRMTVLAVTAAKTLKYSDLNQVITNRGAVATVTVTLPNAAGAKGRWVDFMVIADFEFIIVADVIVGHDNAAATTITITTAGDHIGTGGRLISDGTAWLYFPAQDSTLVTVSVS